MGNSLKWSGVTLALAAGVLLGFAVTTAGYRNGWVRVPGPHRFVERLDHELKLTPDQLHQIQMLVRDTRMRMDQLRDDFHRHHQQIIFQTHDRIRELLTPEQQQKFDREFSPPPEHPPGDRPGRGE